MLSICIHCIHCMIAGLEGYHFIGLLREGKAPLNCFEIQVLFIMFKWNGKFAHHFDFISFTLCCIASCSFLCVIYCQDYSFNDATKTDITLLFV